MIFVVLTFAQQASSGKLARDITSHGSFFCLRILKTGWECVRILLVVKLYLIYVSNVDSFSESNQIMYLYDANYDNSNAVSIFRHPLLVVHRYIRVKTIQYGVTTHGKSLRGAFLQTTWLPPHEVSGHSSQLITWDTQSGKRERKSKEGQGEKESR